VEQGATHRVSVPIRWVALRCTHPTKLFFIGCWTLSVGRSIFLFPLAPVLPWKLEFQPATHGGVRQIVTVSVKPVFHARATGDVVYRQRKSGSVLMGCALLHPSYELEFA
jgi:hypothetical protein